MRCARTATLFTGLWLALPGAALAQSAGDGASPAPGMDPNAPPLTESAPPEASSSKPQVTTRSTATAQRRLPNTGADAGLVALLGVGLLLTGSGLRLRLGEPVAPSE